MKQMIAALAVMLAGMVPEPSPWLMMLGAFWLAGWQLGRRSGMRLRRAKVIGV